MYSSTPLLTVTPSGGLALTYGDAPPSLAGYGYTLSGYLGADASADSVTGSLNGSTPYAAGSGVGTYAVNFASGSLASALGYGFTYANYASGITVSPRTLTAALTVTVSKTFDGTTVATLTPGNYLLSGVFGSDAVSLNNPSVGSYDTPSVGTSKTVFVSGLALSGTAAGNYVLSSTTTSGPVGRIDVDLRSQIVQQQATINRLTRMHRLHYLRFSKYLPPKGEVD